MATAHSIAIKALVQKFQEDGKSVFDNHSGKDDVFRIDGRRPDIIVSSPNKEWCEVEFVGKEPLPKTEGLRRTLYIVTSSDWDSIQIIDDKKIREVTVKACYLDCSIQSLEEKYQQLVEERDKLEAEITRRQFTLADLSKEIRGVRRKLHPPRVRNSLSRFNLVWIEHLNRRLEEETGRWSKVSKEAE